MKDWSSPDALKAYLETLHLSQRKGDGNEDVTEPKCMELISAMAAGKGAKSILEITTKGITQLTIALAVAAKHTGGQLICILSSPQSSDDDHQQHPDSIAKAKLNSAGLQRFIKLVHADAGSSPWEQLKKVDFAVVDCKLDDDHLKLMFKKVDVIRTGWTLIVHNVDHRKHGLDQLLRRRRVESVTLPIGEGTEMIRILGYSFRRRNRFLVTTII
ncbi:hypothetical protein V6N13_098832 [Hibiscus sabdariffa]|uniref:O-methyltransferase n=1 Tax=Hibiscus sabdariffa TaxID=183260 RepID=A0ABR2EF20_9ROSI